MPARHPLASMPFLIGRVCYGDCLEDGMDRLLRPHGDAHERRRGCPVGHNYWDSPSGQTAWGLFCPWDTGLGEILRVIFTQGGSLTGGPVGLMLPSSEYQSMMPYYFYALSTALFTLLCILMLVRSRIGLAFVAIRRMRKRPGPTEFMS